MKRTLELLPEAGSTATPLTSSSRANASPTRSSPSSPTGSSKPPWPSSRQKSKPSGGARVSWRAYSGLGLRDQDRLASLARCACCARCLLRLHASLALTLTVPAGSSPSFFRPKIFFELVLSVCALSFAAMTHCLAYVWGFDFQGPQPFEFLNDFTLSSWSDFLDIFLQVWNFPASPSISLSHRVVHRSCLPPGPLAHRVSHRARRCHRAARAHGARSLGIRHGSH